MCCPFKNQYKISHMKNRKNVLNTYTNYKQNITQTIVKVSPKKYPTLMEAWVLNMPNECFTGVHTANMYSSASKHSPMEFDTLLTGTKEPRKKTSKCAWLPHSNIWFHHHDYTIVLSSTLSTRGKKEQKQIPWCSIKDSGSIYYSIILKIAEKLCPMQIG